MSELKMAILVLPFPPTLNHMWGRKGKATFPSKAYKTWKEEANAVFLQQKRAAGAPIKGNFTYHLLLDEKRRARAMDGDNRNKAPLDFLQSVGMIENDKLADSGSWSWGPCDPDMCVISVYQKGLQPA